MERLFTRLYTTFKDREYIYYLPLAMLCIALRERHFFRIYYSGKGFPQSADSQWYLDYAHGLIKSFRIGLHMDDIMYFGYNTLLALLLAIFKNPVTVIFVQAFVSGLSVILVYQIARMLFNRGAAIIASYFYADNWNISIWSMYILSDSFFSCLLLLTVFLLLKYIESPTSIYRPLFVVSMLYMLVFRPTGIMSAVFLLLYLLVLKPPAVWIGYLKRNRYIIVGALAAVMLLCGLAVASGKLDPLIVSMQDNAKKVLYNIYANGWIYDRSTSHDYVYKPDYTIDIAGSLVLSFVIHNFDHILVLYAKRIFALPGWWIWSTDLRTKAGIVSFFWNILPTVLLLIGTVAAIRGRLFRKASVVWLVMLSVFLFCIVFFIDAMYRYKAPSLPFIAIAAGYGAERVISLALGLIKPITRKLTWIRKSY
ncbi:glycosyltransferase family 39 protein [Paenibacillus cymbidii]|uniref:glycosyltransferase family 39 protein n=1 Tax=Paenibacillus cymbidii TaxID=1639034 RepID=UPI0014367176|nr:glycosyltransferase family 39 protein [Paenibacillus cymbidii]